LEQLVRTGLLYDFYGGLLTEKQRKTMELYYLENWSLAEIAAEEGVSRQAVHDLLQRCGKIIEKYEEKLGLLERFTKQQSTLATITQKLRKVLESLPENSSNFKELAEIDHYVAELIESEL
jgi:uncharacterized protein